MKRIVVALLSIILFVAITFGMAHPAYTDIPGLSLNAQANTVKNEIIDIRHEITVSVPNEKAPEPEFENDNSSIAPPQPLEHIHKFTQTTVPATCTKAGYTQGICECGETEKTIIKALGHKYGKWTTKIQATPDANGLKTRQCTRCTDTQNQTVVFKFKSDCAVYIPSANIHAAFTIADFTQKSVDAYDVVYARTDYIDAPFILGHNYRSLRTLYDTKIGDIIYVNKNGTLIRYKVIVSEYGIQNEARNSITGQKTGVTIWEPYEEEVLRMYTCYGKAVNDRWIVFAVRLP